MNAAPEKFFDGNLLDELDALRARLDAQHVPDDHRLVWDPVTNTVIPAHQRVHHRARPDGPAPLFAKLIDWVMMLVFIASMCSIGLALWILSKILFTP